MAEEGLTRRVIADFGAWLKSGEKSRVTVEKYLRDVTAFAAYLSGGAVTKNAVIAYKKSLIARNYAAARGIESGCIFVTRTGKPMSRTNIWREMKSLCCQANINPSKVFPHNMRHLFARTFYGVEKDIAKLADLLGHSSINL